MTMVETELSLPVPPPQIWQALIAFDDYARWHPFIRLSGAAAMGAEIDYIYTLKLGGRRALPAPATIIAFEAGRLLAWRTRVRPIMMIVEGFELRAEGPGTKLRHWTEYRGLLDIVSGRKMGERAGAMMRETDLALRSYLVRATKKNRRRR